MNAWSVEIPDDLTPAIVTCFIVVGNKEQDLRWVLEVVYGGVIQ